MPVIFDHQHRGKPNKPGQFGTCHDLDGDGTTERHETEVWLVEGYIASAQQQLVLHDIQSALFCNGYYHARHASVGDLARLDPSKWWAYLACHINGSNPPGDYGCVFHDARSTGGRLLAELLAQALSDELPELRGDVRVYAASSTKHSRAYSTIKGIWNTPSTVSGVCFEPCFVNHPDHAALLTHEGLARIGRAAASGARGWLASQGGTT